MLITRPEAEKQKSEAVIAQSSARRNAPANSNEDQSTIAEAEEILRARCKKTADVVQQKWVFAFLSDTQCAACTLEDFAYNVMLGGRGRVFESSCLMAFRYRCQTSCDRRRR